MRAVVASLATLLVCGGTLGADVVINEIHYDGTDKTVKDEFVELYNSGASTVDLSGWSFADAVDFSFPPGSSIASSNYLLVARDPATVLSSFGSAALGPWVGKLSNDGDTLELRDNGGTLIDTVDYTLGFPWPTRTEGSSIELVHPSLDNELGGTWRSSATVSSDPDEVFVPAADFGWRFYRGTNEASSPKTLWRQIQYPAESSWETGQTPIGYGDGDDNTDVLDMRYNYSSLFLRKSFVIAPGTVPSSALLRVYVDDGCVVWINGDVVARLHVGAGELDYDDTASNHESAWEEITITNASSVLLTGTNVIAIHVLNQAVNSSDLSIDVELKAAPATGSDAPSPLARNRAFSTNSAPILRQVRHSPKQPTNAQDVVVSVKATDADGIDSVTLEVQVVAPGNYLRASDAAYATNWTSYVMNDGGTNGDLSAADQTFSVTLPGAVNQNRHLIRYRIVATDASGRSLRVPYADDESRNFAYFVYNGAPAWSGALNPGTTPTNTIPAAVMNDSLPIYHVLGDAVDVERSQYNSSYDTDRFLGTIVYGDTVYDHIQFRNRGVGSTYNTGKNKWKFYFNRGAYFEARDNYGKKYAEPWRILNLNNAASPWAPMHRGMAGVEEAAAHRAFELGGVYAQHTHMLHLRVIDDLNEAAPNDQYDSDFWGIYSSIEQTDGRYLSNYDLPDGNVYEVQGSANKKNQGEDQTSTDNDYDTMVANANTGSSEAWWRTNIALESFYSFQALTHGLGNVDIRSSNNHGYYHHPNGQWYVIPRDHDMMFVAETHWSGLIAIWDALNIATFRMEYRNRTRELIDLMFSDTNSYGGQFVQLVDELSEFVNPVGQAHTIADADAAMWNYHPRSPTSTSCQRKHRGAFYTTPITDCRIGGSYTRTLVSADHEGQMQYLKQYATDTDTDGSFAIGDGDPDGYGYNYMDFEASDTDIPHTPSLSYQGPAGFPRNGLTFSSSAFGDPQGAGSFGGMEWRLAQLYSPNTPDYVANTPWRYEIESTWESGEQTAFTNTITIPSSYVSSGLTYRVRARHQDDTGRWSHWSEPVTFLAGADTATDPHAGLIISELHYNPVGSDETEFIEVLNTSASSIDMNGVAITGGVDITFPIGLTLPASGRVVAVENELAFSNLYQVAASPWYASNIIVAGQWSGQLANGGEFLALVAPDGESLDAFQYGDDAPWSELADGDGPSLVRSDLASDGTAARHWRSSCHYQGSPGRPDLCSTDLRVTEILSHSDTGEDWVELHNAALTPAVLSNVFISDQSTVPSGYAISNGLTIPPGGFAVFTESQMNLRWSELGDSVTLTQSDGSNIIAILDTRSFEAGAADRPFATYRRSDGVIDFPATSAPTPGASNAPPYAAPIVISEVMYAPGPGGDAYVELFCSAPSNQPLYDVSNPSNTWGLSGDVTFTFSPGQIMTRGRHTLIVASNDPYGFRLKYAVPPEIAIFGPYVGAADARALGITLRQPGKPETNSFVPQIAVDHVRFASDSPWPSAANGSGPALERIGALSYGNDPTNWRTINAFGSPGTASQSDDDGDGAPDGWERLIQGDTSAGNAALIDSDGDGGSDLREYLLGSSATNRNELPQLDISVSNDTLWISHPAAEATGPGYYGLRREYDFLTFSGGSVWSVLPGGSNVSASSGRVSMTYTPPPSNALYRVRARLLPDSP